MEKHTKENFKFKNAYYKRTEKKIAIYREFTKNMAMIKINLSTKYLVI